MRLARTAIEAFCVKSPEIGRHQAVMPDNEQVIVVAKGAPEVLFRASQHSRARCPHGTVATRSEWLPAPCRMDAASPASPCRIGAQPPQAVRNLRTDRAHRITTCEHHRAAHIGTYACARGPQAPSASGSTQHAARSGQQTIVGHIIDSLVIVDPKHGCSAVQVK